jgi:ribonuclease HI
MDKPLKRLGKSGCKNSLLLKALAFFLTSHKGRIAPLARQVTEESMDHSRPWEFFYGASQNEGLLCGGGAVLHLSYSHLFKMKWGLGPGTNNFAELMALKLLLTFAGEKGISNLQIFGDSMVIINWIRKSQKCHNIRLLPLLDEVFLILDTYSNFSIHHVYRERNRATTNSLRRVFSWLMGKWHIVESREGSNFEYYHRPFIEAGGHVNLESQS